MTGARLLAEAVSLEGHKHHLDLRSIRWSDALEGVMSGCCLAEPIVLPTRGCVAVLPVVGFFPPREGVVIGERRRRLPVPKGTSGRRLALEEGVISSHAILPTSE